MNIPPNTGLQWLQKAQTDHLCGGGVPGEVVQSWRGQVMLIMLSEWRDVVLRQAWIHAQIPERKHRNDVSRSKPNRVLVYQVPEYRRTSLFLRQDSGAAAAVGEYEWMLGNHTAAAASVDGEGFGLEHVCWEESQPNY